ncbi:hypothetical protein CBL_10417 [Carabus blaptoides fortunei]
MDRLHDGRNERPWRADCKEQGHRSLITILYQTVYYMVLFFGWEILSAGLQISQLMRPLGLMPAVYKVVVCNILGAGYCSNQYVRKNGAVRSCTVMPPGYISLTVLLLFVRDLVVIFRPSDKAQVDGADILGGCGEIDNNPTVDDTPLMSCTQRCNQNTVEDNRILSVTLLHAASKQEFTVGDVESIFRAQLPPTIATNNKPIDTCNNTKPGGETDTVGLSDTRPPNKNKRVYNWTRNILEEKSSLLK